MGILSAAIALFSSGGEGQQERLPEQPSSDGDEPKSTILVIDDDPLLLQTVKSLLVKRGFNVLTSSSSPKGLDMLRYAARDIRIVVLDYKMPKLDGGETLNFIKQLSPNARVIGLTAMNLDSVTVGYLEGVDKLLSKPVVATELLGAVDELLGVGQSQEEPVSKAVNPVSSNPSCDAKTVLVAEDEPEVREFLAAVLREMGCIVLEAENGDRALHIFERSRGLKIDLLLTDIVMPVLGGKELAYRVGSLYPETKIVFCSAYPEKLGVGNGMFDKQIPFLQKPVTINAVKLKVREVLGEATEDLQQSSAKTLQD